MAQRVLQPGDVSRAAPGAGRGAAAGSASRSVGFDRVQPRAPHRPVLDGRTRTSHAERRPIPRRRRALPRPGSYFSASMPAWAIWASCCEVTPETPMPPMILPSTTIGMPPSSTLYPMFRSRRLAPPDTCRRPYAGGSAAPSRCLGAAIPGFLVL